MHQFLKQMAKERKTLESDIEYGLRREKELFEPIQKHFGVELKPAKDKYALYDFRGLGIRVELKSRRNKKNTYATTLIGKNKVDNAKRIQIDVKSYFVFDFTDGLYCIKYNEELFKTFEVVTKGRNDRGKDEYNKYYEIPVNLLQQMSV